MNDFWTNKLDTKKFVKKKKNQYEPNPCCFVNHVSEQRFQVNDFLLIK